MARDYAKAALVRSKMSKQKPGHKGTIFAVLFLLGLVTAVGYLVYNQKTLKELAGNQGLAQWASKLHNLTHHQKDASEPVVKKKASILKKEGAPPVKFDFYTELPNMKMAVPEVQNTVVAVPTKRPVDRPLETGAKKAPFDSDEISNLLAAEEAMQPASSKSKK